MQTNDECSKYIHSVFIAFALFCMYSYICEHIAVV